MIFNIVYMTDKDRVINGIINDSQFIIPPISNQLGVVVKSYADTQINATGSNSVLPYKIITELGNIAGYFTLQTNGSIAVIQEKQLRPSFVNFDTEITAKISNFIQKNEWVDNFLQ